MNIIRVKRSTMEFKEELIKYCEQDVKALFKYNTLVF